MDRLLSRANLRLCVVLMLLVVLGSSSSVEAQGAPRLLEVQIVGTQTVRPEQVVGWAGLRVDQQVTREAVARAIRSLYATGKFREVFVYEVVKDNGIELVLNLIEYPRLAELRFEGNDKLDENDLEEGIDLKVGDFLSPAILRRAEVSIREKYKSEGYFNATADINDALIQLTGSQPLIVNIVEGSKVRVRRFAFRGNSALTDDQIRDGFTTKTDGILRSGTFKAPEFEADLQRIVANYENEGYLDAQVVSHEIVFLEDDENHIELRIVVEEGERYSVGQMRFSGNTVFETARLESMLSVEAGEIFREDQFSESVRNLSTLYWDSGYIYIVVSPQRSVQPGNVVDVEFVIREGEQASIRQVDFAGNTKTREYVLRRELRIEPGDLFSNSDLRNSQGDLFRLGFFNDVRVDFNETEQSDKIDLIFEVEEKQTGQFQMGVGFSQQTQASGFFNIGENNLFGRGQSLNFAWQFGRRRNFLDISFTEPWFMGTPTSIGVDIYNRFSNRIQDYYDTRVRGFAVRLGRPIPGARYTRASIRYKYNQTTLRNFDPYYVSTLDRLERELGSGGFEFQRLDKTKWPQVETGITTSLTRNSTNNPFFPTAGSNASLRHELNGGPFGGDLDYQRILVDYDWYQSLPLKLALHVGSSAGHLLAYGKTDQVPDYVRFRLGGNRFFKLRGYRDLEVVPRGNPAFVGGRFYSTVTAEVAYQITRAIHVLGFVDQGDVWNSFDEADLTNLRTGAGLGLRLEVPLVGRIGLDYGYGFNKDGLDSDPGWEAHFNFGQFF